MRWWTQWLSERASRRGAAAYVAAITGEPEEEQVRWLASWEPASDEDHARWELRYARRALGLLTAQRDALDDRTGSLVAAELGAALARDPNVASGKDGVANRQFNDRLHAYGEALATRGTDVHALLGAVLLGFLGREPAPRAASAQVGEILTAYLADANASLRRHFGSPNLPSDVPPSAAAAGR